MPQVAIDELDAGKRPSITVSIGDYSWKSTIGVMSGRYLISLSKAHRESSGLSAGDDVVVTLELDEGIRVVEVPSDLLAALQEYRLLEKFEALSFSSRKEYARQVTDAKSNETKVRRIAKIISQLN